MPTIVSSKGQSNIEAIKRYFCSEYACQMVAQAAGVDYERMIAGDYKLLIEPIAYFTHNGQYYCMTATEAALYDQKIRRGASENHDFPHPQESASVDVFGI